MADPKQLAAEPSSQAAANRGQQSTHTATSATELREFLRRMEGKSPQEVLGIVSESGLVRATIASTIGFFLLLVALTLVPYWLQGDSAAGDQSPAGSRSESGSRNESGNVAGTEAPENNASSTASSTDPSGAGSGNGTGAGTNPGDSPATTGSPNLDRAVDSMGIGETRSADPDANPLDSDLDSLLDGVK